MFKIFPTNVNPEMISGQSFTGDNPQLGTPMKY